MKTILIVLGSLFVLSRLQGGQGLTLSIGAAPAGGTFHPTPPGGGAASIIPPGGDPYANIQNLPPSGGGGIGLSVGGASGGGTGYAFHSSIVSRPTSTFLARVSPGGVRTLQQ